jgi:hypothetical protein
MLFTIGIGIKDHGLQYPRQLYADVQFRKLHIHLLINTEILPRLVMKVFIVGHDLKVTSNGPNYQVV